MTRSLVTFGLDARDEADLLFYFFEQRDEPKDWAAADRWKPVHRFFREHWDARLSEMEGQLRQFYERGLQSWAANSQAARREYEDLHAMAPMPPHVQPGAPGSAAYFAWLSKERAKPTSWITTS
jgi:hypothetical protein